MRFAVILTSALMAGKLVAAPPETALEPPTIPVGLDAYRQWERWPYQRIGARAYMRSTYDRTGGNESADASHFLYQESNAFNVTLDVEGAGVLLFARYNHWHGSPWHYEVDGHDYLVQESSSGDPTRPVSGSVFLPTDLFPSGLTWTWSMTKGADLMWVPIPFERSFRMAYSRTRYGTGYYIFHQYVPGAKLSQPIHSWNTQTVPDSDVLDLLRRSGSDIAPNADAGIVRFSRTVDVPRNAIVSVVNITNAPAMIRALELSVSTNQAVDFSRAFLRVTWDKRPQPSIDTPVALFFGIGTFYNRDGREYLVKAFPVHVKYEGGRVRMACYFPMPFFEEAKIELVGATNRDFSAVECSVRYEPFHDSPAEVGYLHATYRDHLKPQLGQDLTLLDTRQAEGGGDWSGSFVGTSFIFTDRNNLSTLEGDPRFYFDDSQSPQAYGTGTEEWGGGGDYWGGLNMTLPFAGHPVGARTAQEAKCDEDKIHSAYRFLLADLMPFGKNAVIHLEHGGLNDSKEHYQTVAYWYGAPAASLVKSDELDVGDIASEKGHDYLSPNASQPYEISSRYEWGADLYITGTNGEVLYPQGFRSLTQRDLPSAGSANHVVAFPAQKETGRTTTTWSEFTLKLMPQNVGVMLRRKLDYQFPNQRAKVFVADAPAPGRTPSDLEWHSAGIWYLAGANTCVYSDPKGELGETLHHVETSNRRFRDDEFLVPRALTQGRSAIRVRVEFTPVQRPLFPGYPLPELAWSELRYYAYCFVVPHWNPEPRR
jgi:D-arabinan exo alpha-(1,3)/(1,5)-arabinofuranosidase (non-reducing end)